MVLKKRLFYLFYLVFFLCNARAQTISLKYEMRGVWIATVLNIDYPSKPGLSIAQQKQEFVNLLDKDKQMGMNAVFVQVRPAGDAFYPSRYDPWSEFLTGKQGQAPSPFYDPLKFMIDETHKRGMEFHAWINPYRMVFDVTKSSVAPNHVTKLHPEWFVNYGKQKIFNPGLPQSIDYLVGVVSDIVNRYDVDGIHFDDYFYPYPTSQHFNDDAAYKKYGRGLSLDDWRRANCDSAIKRVHDAILRLKPMVKFGVSPFGIFQNKSQDADGSNTTGLTNYHQLYADILLWLRKGWIDYVAPQLYWAIGKQGQDYRVLLDWWAHHTYGKDLYIGQAVYHADERDVSAFLRSSELPNEIKLLRQYPQVKGSIYFSNKSFLSDPGGFVDSLEDNYYKYPALVPPMKWVDNNEPNAPELWISPNENLQIHGMLDEVSQSEIVNKYVLYVSQDAATLGQQPIQIIGGSNGISWFYFSVLPQYIPSGATVFYAAVTSVDKENNESGLSNIIRFQKLKNGNWRGFVGY
ncbi:hypothetical protein A9P82_07425 [Arachidicoccus ginsenosidimutans]|uniref:glycoside hydrolase family 10 protein n=1 Tax=Arachidicoccus sp. BS20 TaxID=1850526 RepID=UPI0007F10B03|nr:family 10 glycosylhydrolase [Arachidicoccus sp. BS20]ANI89135.1 hypothetical protein A9P82_07425 [Arachidicoccus sp. BS20]